MIAPLLKQQPTPKKPGLRQQVRQLEQMLAMYERGNASQQEAMDKMAENMTHLIMRLEGVRTKFNLSVDEVNQLGEEYLAKMSEAEEMKRAAAINIKELSVNGVTYRPATPPEIAPLSPPRASTEAGSPSGPTGQAPQGSPPAHCASDGERTGS